MQPKRVGFCLGMLLALNAGYIAHANGTSETTIINTEVNSTVGPETPPLNGGDSIIISPTGSINTFFVWNYPTDEPEGDRFGVIGANGYNSLRNAGVINSSSSGTELWSWSEAVFMSGGNSSVINSGTISANGFNSIGVELGSGWPEEVGYNTLSNLGTISVSGKSSTAVVTRLGNNAIDNSGLIEAYGQYSGAVVALGGFTDITNIGSIKTNGDNGHAIYMQGERNQLTNSGSVTTQGIGSMGVYSTDLGIRITNTGTIATYGDGSADAIRTYGGQASISNIGQVQTQGAFGGGISAFGGSNIINNSGVISTKWGTGIVAWGGNSSVQNSGVINAMQGDGISSGGGSANIIENFGAITVVYGGSGISSSDGYSKITNVGTINAYNRYANAITSYDDFNSIFNGGVLTAEGEDSAVVGVFGNGNTLTNNGRILSSSIFSADAAGIMIIGSNNSLANSGEISSYKGATTIIIQGDENSLTNYGAISNSYPGGSSIKIDGDLNVVSNYGSITSSNGYALAFNGSGNSFNSYNNFLAGRVNMGSGGTVSITTGANYSKLYTFEGTNLIINGSGTVPLFINSTTQQAGTYDPTIFASSSDALADMSSAISSLTPGRFNGTDKEHPVWARGFGTTASYSGSYSGADTTLDRNYIFSGVALGIDAVRSKDLVIGFLGGYGQTSLTADAESTQSFNNTSDGGFLGLYGQKRWKSWAFDFALNGGFQSFQQQRYVNDNLAYLGNSSTQASFQGWWIAPELAATVKLAEVNGWSLLPTARLRYAQQWMGGYTETGGAAANASVSGRNVTIGQSFVGIGTQKTIKTILGKNTKMVLDGQVGYMYRGVVGDDTVDVTMIGQSLSLPTEISSRNAVAVSAGVALDLSSAVTLKIRGDAAAGGGMNYVGGGWAGLSFKF